MARILITGARLWYAYNSINILSEHGHELYAADGSKLSLGFYSKNIKKSFIYPDISEKAEGFIERILAIIEKYEIEYLLPVFEESYVLSYYKKKLEGKVKFVLPEFEIVSKLHDKYFLLKLAEDLKIPTPITYSINEYKPSILSFPVVLKPRRERGAEGVKIIKNIDEFNIYENKHNLEDYIAQEYISNEQYCTMGLAKNGELISNTIYHNLEEYPYKGGFGVLRESVEVAIINEYIKRIVEKTKYSGFICVDFLKDPINEIYKITDINPRMSPGLMVAYSEGIDLCKIYLDLAENKKIEAVFSKGGKGTHTSALRLGWFLQVIFSGNFKMLNGFAKRKENKIEDVWNSKDPKPFFAFFVHLLLSSIIGPIFFGSTSYYYHKKGVFKYKKFLKKQAC
jgi:predicted ATP-grasp superfamily ATP-dependent carboligase